MDDAGGGLLDALLAGGHGAVSVVGLAKNVGKTTTLNHLIEGAASRPGVRLGVTSAGWDGEACDSITHGAKPRILLPRGFLAATTDRCLERSPLEWALVEETSMRTGLGTVAIVEAVSSGLVELAGPATVSQLGQVRARLAALGATLVILDGAINRKASSSPLVCDGVILATGMNAGCNRDEVVRLTSFWAHIFTLPPSRVPVPAAAPREALVVDGDGTVLARPSPWSPGAVRRVPPGGALVLPGALSDEIVEEIGKCAGPCRLVVEDSTRLFLTPPVLRRWEKKGGSVQTRAGRPLLGITVNPTSVSGRRTDPGEFLDEMAGACSPIPVWDVVLGRRGKGSA